MRTKWTPMGIIAAVAVSCCILGRSAQAQGTHPTRDFMRQKLTYTQGIVEGLVSEKYELVVTNGTALRNMSLTNAFFQLGNPDYFERIKHFQAKVDGLVNAAKAKDLEKSSEQYSEVVNSCVACHKSFRREQFQAHR